jgi:hypothetical protein
MTAFVFFIFKSAGEGEGCFEDFKAKMNKSKINNNNKTNTKHKFNVKYERYKQDNTRFRCDKQTLIKITLVLDVINQTLSKITPVLDVINKR